MQNSTKGLVNRVEQGKERIHEFENRSIEIFESEGQKGKRTGSQRPVGHNQACTGWDTQRRGEREWSKKYI